VCLPKAPRRGRQRNSLGERIDVVQLAGFDQRSDDGAVLGAAVGACKERIFPVQDDRRMELSTGQLSSLIRPSSRKRVSPFQRESASDRVGELALLTDQTTLCA
jgi:hypothetical protein